MNTANGPLGNLGPFVASIIAVLTIGAAVIVHVLEALGRAQGDAFLDSLALLVAGVVLGVGVIGGQASTALQSAQAAHERLDQIHAPQALDVKP